MGLITIPFDPTQKITTLRHLALKAARQAFCDGRFGISCMVHYDEVIYLVTKDGVVRQTYSPDGRMTSERMV